ncbi:MAG: serine hydrolase [Solirubrobacterales bacterium]
MVRICPKCFTVNPEKYELCETCGTLLTDEKPMPITGTKTPPAPPPKRRKELSETLFEAGSEHERRQRLRQIRNLGAALCIAAAAALFVWFLPAATVNHPVPSTPADPGYLDLAPHIPISAPSAILIDADSGAVLYAKNPDIQVPPASTTKLMTLLLALDSMDAGEVMPDDRVQPSKNAASVGGAHTFRAGETITFRDLLTAIAIGTANDACVALAEHLEGTPRAFVDRMNQRARQLGMKHTRFVNAYGLSAHGQYTTAADIAKLGQAALRHPEITKYTSIREASLRNGAVTLSNSNKLLWMYRGADGLKTGWTQEARFCLVSTVKRNQFRLIAAVFGSPDPKGHFKDSIKLFDYGFGRFSFVPYAKAGQTCGTVSVWLGKGSEVKAIPAENVGLISLAGREHEVTFKKTLKRRVMAPVPKGAQLGRIDVYRKGQLVKSVDLVAKNRINSWL